MSELDDLLNSWGTPDEEPEEKDGHGWEEYGIEGSEGLNLGALFTDIDPAKLTLHDKKIYEDGRGKEIDNEKKLGTLFLRSLFVSMMGEVGQSIQTNFVDIPRRDASRLAAEWGIPDKERQIEKDLADIIKTALESFESDYDRIIDEGTFD